MRDNAVSNAVAILMMIATVIGVSAAVFIHAVYGADEAHGSIGLEVVRGSPDLRIRELLVANASDNLTYQSVAITLEGQSLKYDSGDSGTGYCIAPKGGPCVDKDEWLPRDHKVLPGDKIRIHGSGLGGKKVDVLLDTRQAWEGYLAAA